MLNEPAVVADDLSLPPTLQRAFRHAKVVDGATTRAIGRPRKRHCRRGASASASVVGDIARPSRTRGAGPARPRSGAQPAVRRGEAAAGAVIRG
jgi:hypothetical protein